MSFVPEEQKRQFKDLLPHLSYTSHDVKGKKSWILNKVNQQTYIQPQHLLAMLTPERKRKSILIPIFISNIS